VKHSLSKAVLSCVNCRVSSLCGSFALRHLLQSSQVCLKLRAFFCSPLASSVGSHSTAHNSADVSNQATADINCRCHASPLAPAPLRNVGGGKQIRSQETSARSKLPNPVMISTAAACSPAATITGKPGKRRKNWGRLRSGISRSFPGVSVRPVEFPSPVTHLVVVSESRSYNLRWNLGMLPQDLRGLRICWKVAHFFNTRIRMVAAMPMPAHVVSEPHTVQGQAAENSWLYHCVQSTGAFAVAWAAIEATFAICCVTPVGVFT